MNTQGTSATTPAAEERYRLPVTIRKVGVDQTGAWLAAGWRDFLRAPAVSLIYGIPFVVFSYAITIGLVDFGLGSLVLPLAGGFFLVAPVLVVGLYDVSRRLETGDTVTFGSVCFVCLRNAGQVAAMGVVLLLIHFVWILIAIVLFALFFGDKPPPLETFVMEVLFSLKGAPFLLLGTVSGAALAALSFTVTAVSIPMLLDRDLDVVTAIGASILTVRANMQAMFGWAAMIALITACGMAAFYVGLAVALPVLGYATWHAYRDMIEPAS